mmetsp:Transcript_37885/g.93111  ORF Transcript_37885/g.93111 Transcript_37885/m.93111 type:complete len:319 (-) Transcript_37885:246-1202(-)
MSLRAALAPSSSMRRAARSTSSRACSMATRLSAMSRRITPLDARVSPKATRLVTRSQCSASALSHMPISRMQWWILPGPSLPCATSKPLPSPRIRFSLGTCTSRMRHSACPCGASSYPNTVSGRSTSNPLAGSGTMMIDCCLCAAACGSVFPMKMHMPHRGSIAPDVHHLRPLSTYDSPSRTIDDWMLVASHDATSGSVMAKHERISPLRRGVSHRSFCSSVPYLSSTSMLPVSGAEQLNTSDAKGTAPISSARTAYCSLVSPPPIPPTVWAPGSMSSGTQRFHSPSALALAFSSSMIFSGVQRSGPPMCSMTAGSAG